MLIPILHWPENLSELDITDSQKQFINLFLEEFVPHEFLAFEPVVDLQTIFISFTAVFREDKNQKHTINYKKVYNYSPQARHES